MKDKEQRTREGGKEDGKQKKKRTETVGTLEQLIMVR